MPLFTLPLPTNSAAPQSRVRFSSLPAQNKRKRDASPTLSVSDNDDEDDAKEKLRRREAMLATNPLSLTPAEVMQYRLAGLDLDERLPDVKGWPHRGLSSDHTLVPQTLKRDIKGKGKERITGGEYYAKDVEGDDAVMTAVAEEERKVVRLPALRLQHLAVLTTILHRCLLEEDIPRAKRAWAMLIRAQIGGQGIDLKGSGYWGIGVELLMRSGEKPRPRILRRNSDADSVDEAPPAVKEEAEVESNVEATWGPVDGLEMTIEYYMRLIVQYPYKRQYHDNISALDFWPAMVACEIFGIQYEHKESLRKFTEQGDNEDGEEPGSGSDSELDDMKAEEDIYLAQERRKAGRRQRREEQRWQDRDEIRQTALVAYENLARRLDERMLAPPYYDSHVLIRLRGMLALCIGDLCTPALPPDENLGDGNEEDLERYEFQGIGGKDTERRFIARERRLDRERGKERQREERLRARTLFERIESENGRREALLNSLPKDEDDAGERRPGWNSLAR